MAVLKKLKGSTLMETMVATVLIIVIFMISSLILNNIFSGYVQGSMRSLENRIRELEYKVINGNMKIPYYEVYENWELEIIKEQQEKDSLLIITAKEIHSDKTFIKAQILE